MEGQCWHLALTSSGGRSLWRASPSLYAQSQQHFQSFPGAFLSTEPPSPTKRTSWTSSYSNPHHFLSDRGASARGEVLFQTKQLYWLLAGGKNPRASEANLSACWCFWSPMLKSCDHLSAAENAPGRAAIRVILPLRVLHDRALTMLMFCLLW